MLEIPSAASSSVMPAKPASPPMKSPANEMTILTVGLAFKPLFNVIVKADYSVFKNEADSGVDQISVALGYLF